MSEVDCGERTRRVLESQGGERGPEHDKASQLSSLWGVTMDRVKHKQAGDTEREHRRFAEALCDSVAVLTGSLDIDNVMQQLLDTAATVIPSEAGSIILSTVPHQFRLVDVEKRQAFAYYVSLAFENAYHNRNEPSGCRNDLYRQVIHNR